MATMDPNTFDPNVAGASGSASVLGFAPANVGQMFDTLKKVVHLEIGRLAGGSKDYKSKDVDTALSRLEQVVHLFQGIDRKPADPKQQLDTPRARQIPLITFDEMLAAEVPMMRDATGTDSLPESHAFMSLEYALNISTWHIANMLGFYYEKPWQPPFGETTSLYNVRQALRLEALRLAPPTPPALDEGSIGSTAATAGGASGASV